MRLPLDLILAFYWGCNESFNDIVADDGPWVYDEPELQACYDFGCRVGDWLHSRAVRLGIIRYAY